MEATIAARASVILSLLKRAGPYVLLEVVLPGGTLFALLLYLHRTGKLRALAQPETMVKVAGDAASAIAFALQPAGSLAVAGREDGLELKMLAACR